MGRTNARGEPRGIGIDGCPGGWAVVSVESAGGDTEVLTLNTAVHPDISSLWAALEPNPALDRMLIDMPIGLAEGADGVRNRAADRHCDRDCRKLLPPRRKSSVFPVPARQALYADGPSAANLAAIGRKLSRQSLNILPKIRELDEFVAEALESGLPVPAVLAECHPELCFLRLNGGEAPPHGKKEAEGLSERLGILAEAGIPREQLERLLDLFPRKQAARDDLLDAAALALTAYRISSGQSPARYVTEGERRQYDYGGRLEMNIVYV
ncbi:DUF429 domain-containing protein [Saccharibacillus alkalitolerans]|uniref:DUF429 domain-containing protein n=1 Tax=Saccharibacillus alkalitolerans TaxID=2705290 RepID=A0ABX0F7R6_9BACL|nr:DUF429 domain-containing protein [Saccharibacillus alkalitolerans]NGZ77002.1 DUF429 domain-containing protein [Saccharibacillus alkalitolerans]